MNFHDHDDLIRFLRENEPSGPPPPLDHEEELLVRLGQDQPTSTVAKKSGRWWFPTLIAAGLVLVVGHGHHQKTFQQLPGAFNAIITPAPLAERDRELEAFLEQSWANAFGEHFHGEASFSPMSNGEVDFVVNTTP